MVWLLLSVLPAVAWSDPAPVGSIRTKGVVMELPKTYNGLRPPIELPEFPVSKYWDVADLFQTPQFQSAAHFDESYCDGLESILYEGMLVDGVRKPVFAYAGIPDGPVPPGGFPGVVLVHGGGGTAYPSYVKL